MLQLKKDDIKVSYKEKELGEVDDYKLIKSLIHELSNTSTIEQQINEYQKQPPTRFDRSFVNNKTYEALANKLGKSAQGSMQSVKIIPNLRKVLEDYLNEDLSDYYYLDDYTTFIDINKLPVITEINKKEKIVQFYVELFNQLFKPFDKELILDTFYIKIPDYFVSNYEYFVNNKLFLQRFRHNEVLFELINSYFKNILYNKTYNFTFDKYFEHTGLGNQVQYNQKENLLSIKLDNSTGSFMYNNDTTNHYHYQLWLFSSKMISLFTTIEMIGLLRERSVVLNVDNDKEIFLSKIRNRRIPVSQITHKGASKKANSLGLTHLFLPLDEEAIPAGLPFSLKVDLESHDKVANVWTIIPPVKGFSVVRNYIGHNNDYPDYTTLAEPHLVGVELLKTKLNDDFYKYITQNYDWEHKEEAIKTLELIEQYPRLKNDLNKLAKEYSLND